MLKTYLLIAWRTTLKNRLFSSINIISLALSISLCMIVMMHVLDTFRYDNFHPDSDRIYRVVSNIKNGNGNEWTLASSPLPLKDALDNDGPSMFSGVVNLYPSINHEMSDGLKDIPVRGAFTQSSLFTMFGFALAKGDASTVLDRPFTVVLSAATAKKFFTTNDPIGQSLTIGDFGSFEITGVMTELPSKSHIDFDVYVSFETIAALEADRKLPLKSTSWDSFEHAYTYVKLNEKTHRSQFIALLNSISRSVNKESNSGTFTFEPQPLRKITPGTDHLYNDIGNGSTWGKLMAEIGVAFIILIAACFNYTNLSIARSLTRTREVGIRKIAGAKRSQIFFQYLVESILVSLFALCLAQVILEFIISYDLFNDGYEYVPHVRFDFILVSAFILFAIFIGFIAGFLPALLLSSFKAVRLLKNIASEKVMGKLSLRKSLLVFQFSLSLIIIIFLSVFDRQFEFMAESNPGYRIDNILCVQVSAHESERLSKELSLIKEVAGLGRCSGDFGRYVSGASSVSQVKNDPQPVRMDFYFTDSQMIELSGLQFVGGSNFQFDATSDEREVVINEKSVTALGLKTPHDAIGKQIFIDDSVAVSIVGVIKDFYNQGVGNSIRPLMLRQNKAKFMYTDILVLPNSDQRKVQQQLETTWKKLFPEKAINYHWLREQHDRRYAEMGSVSFLGFLAFMTVAIASLGLLGLVVYTVETRRKEISIRKIIGATIYQLTYLLSSGFTKLLLLSAVIALPVGYALGELFLMNFANRISIGFPILFAAFFLLMTIGLLMIGSQTVKAANDNPVKHLRNE